MVSSFSPYRWNPDAAGHSMPVRILLWAWPQTFGSLPIGISAGLLAFVVAALCCIRRTRTLLFIALLSFLIGGELLAIADIRIYNRAAPWPFSGLGVSGRELFGLIYNSALVMVIAYLGRFAWLTLLAGHAGWSRGMRELHDVAAVDGAGPWRTAMSVVWPLLWPMLAAAAMEKSPKRFGLKPAWARIRRFIRAESPTARATTAFSSSIAWPVFSGSTTMAKQSMNGACRSGKEVNRLVCQWGPMEMSISP